MKRGKISGGCKRESTKTRIETLYLVELSQILEIGKKKTIMIGNIFQKDIKKIMEMNYKEIYMIPHKRIALVAHDNKKEELFEWIKWNREILAKHTLYATGTTGKYIEEYLDLPITKLESGPLGGDLQIGSLISKNEIDILIFFWDPLESQPHDPDIKALLRISVVWNIPVACNRATADFIISSELFENLYTRLVSDYSGYKNRNLRK